MFPRHKTSGAYCKKNDSDYSAVIAGVLLIFQAVYVVDGTEQAVVTQFGKIVGEPKILSGPHWKIPFVQQVVLYPKTRLKWNNQPELIPTSEKTYLLVDTFAIWQIDNPSLFFKSVGRNYNAGEQYLDDILSAAVKT